MNSNKLLNDVRDYLHSKLPLLEEHTVLEITEFVMMTAHNYAYDMVDRTLRDNRSAMRRRTNNNNL